MKIKEKNPPLPRKKQVGSSHQIDWDALRIHAGTYVNPC